MTFLKLSTLFCIVALSTVSQSNASNRFSSYEDAGLYRSRRNRKGRGSFASRKNNFHQQHMINHPENLLVSSTEVTDTVPMTPPVAPVVERDENHNDPSSSSSSSVAKMWPPWPFNLINQNNARGGNRSGMQQSQSNKSISTNTGQTTGYRSAAQLFWDYFRQRGRFGIRQFQQMGSDLWFNLPPAAPPLILLAALPKGPFASQPSSIIESGTEVIAETVRAFPPLFANVFARKLALGYLGVAILSWSHYEIHRKRRLVPLPLAEHCKDVQRALLPQFLPESIPHEVPGYVVVTEQETTDGGREEVVSTSNAKDDIDDDGESAVPIKMLSSVPPRLRRQLQNMYDGAPSPRTLKSTFRDWGKMREQRKRNELEIKRLGIMEELIALRSLKERAQEKKKHKSKDSKEGKKKLGYALVTGASRGIGRALAVELARWEIPLILVARDLDALTTLANEIETCYGVKCCVLQADLSQSGVVSKIHQATRDSGLQVDILVNNAGVCSTGLSVDMPTDEVERMIQINTMSVSLLNHLYGKDMKDQGRGRIMVVSSVVGCVPAGPNVATYAATKAFEKSMALSMGKELEQYGVGVTCLMPGPVRNTSFRSKSGSETALCWNLPFYTRTAPTVAHEGVRAMLLGQTEVCPGWQNRVFVKLVMPMIPQRLTTLVVQAAWSTLSIKPMRLPWQTKEVDDQTNTFMQPTEKRAVRTDPTDRPPYHDDSIIAIPPRVLVLPRKKENTDAPHHHNNGSYETQQFDENPKHDTHNITATDDTTTSADNTGFAEDTTSNTESSQISDVVKNSVEAELSRFHNEQMLLQDGEEGTEMENESQQGEKSRDEFNQKVDESLYAESTNHKAQLNSSQWNRNEANQRIHHHQDSTDYEQSNHNTRESNDVSKSSSEEVHDNKPSNEVDSSNSSSSLVPDKEVPKTTKEESRAKTKKGKRKKKARLQTLDDFADSLDPEYLSDLHFR